MSCSDVAINHDATFLLIKTYVEGSVNGLTIVRDLLLGLLKRFSHKVVRLHRTDGEVNVVLSNLEGVKRVVPGLVRDAVLELTNATENASTVGLDAVGLPAEAKLDGEPVNCRKLLNLALTCAERSQSNLLRKVGKVLMCKHRRVT